MDSPGTHQPRAPPERQAPASDPPQSHQRQQAVECRCLAFPDLRLCPESAGSFRARTVRESLAMAVRGLKATA